MNTKSRHCRSSIFLLAVFALGLFAAAAVQAGEPQGDPSQNQIREQHQIRNQNRHVNQTGNGQDGQGGQGNQGGQGVLDRLRASDPVRDFDLLLSDSTPPGDQQDGSEYRHRYLNRYTYEWMYNLVTDRNFVPIGF